VAGSAQSGSGALKIDATSASLLPVIPKRGWIGAGQRFLAQLQKTNGSFDFWQTS